MTLSVESGLEALRASADAEAREDDLGARLGEVQRFLKADLDWIEAELGRAVAAGPSPGTDASAHLVRRGGKRVRPMALLLSAACFGDVPPSARELAVVVELVHSATLLHDDVIDDGHERRGVPAARRLFGNAVSVLAGDLLLVGALDRTRTHGPAAFPSLIDTLRRLVHGEIVQLRGRTTLDVSEDTYESVLRDKTASLFGWATRTGAVLGGAPDAAAAMERFGERLGVAFQLVDDVIDYVGHETGKTLLTDLREGKVTLPLVIAIRERPELLDSVRKVHAGDEGAVEAVRSAVVSSGACDAVRGRAEQATHDAVEALRAIPDTPSRRLLETVATQLVRREG